MEDILSSIKRIIAEEGDGGSAPRPRRTARPSPSSAPRDRPDVSEILELSNRVPADPAPTADPVDAEEAPVEPILSDSATEASRGALDTLSRLIVKPEVAAGPETLEGLVREMLRPMLREWLDARLPGIIETLVAREIARITQGR
ncbi:MAG: hypothetical protein B7Y45_04575 [Sphingomonas sp. 28-66-16]|nr:MAG: hypothetical protein B7Y45_04575 [Sphingomonas sp. 28-66-16]